MKTNADVSLSSCLIFFKAALSKKKHLMPVNTLLSGWANFCSKSEPNFSFQQRFTSFRLIIEMMAGHGIFLIPTTHSMCGPAVAVECHR